MRMEQAAIGMVMVGLFCQLPTWGWASRALAQLQTDTRFAAEEAALCSVCNLETRGQHKQQQSVETVWSLLVVVTHLQIL